MGKLRSIISLLRLSDQLLLVFAILVGNFFLTPSLNFQTISIVIFIVSLTSLTFVINDLADAKLDKLNKKTRNPIAQNKISSKEAKLFAVILFVLTLVISSFLHTNLFYYSLMLIFISITYGFFIKAKSKPPLDLVYHGLGPTIGFLMLSSLYKPFNLSIAFTAIIIFNIFSIIQLLQQIRDFDTDKKLVKTTAILLGKRNSIKACIILLVLSILILVSSVLEGAYTIKSLLFLPLSYLLFEPLFTAANNKIHTDRLLTIFTKRLFVATAFSVLLSMVL